jgi:ribosomal protein L11 methyltransferase
MPTWTALTTLPEKPRAEALGAALETLSPEPVGVGIFEMEDGSGLWEVGAYFTGNPTTSRCRCWPRLTGRSPSPCRNCPRRTGSPM